MPFRSGALGILAACVFYGGSIAGEYREIYRFRGVPDGAHPINALTATGGAFYGVTYGGGAHSKQRGGWGTIFKFDPASGTETTLYRFYEPGDHRAALPYQRLLAANGFLYGVTTCSSFCKKDAQGTIFRFELSHASLALLSRFETGFYVSIGGGLVSWKGAIWGADLGGANLTGAIFRLSKDGRPETIYSFPPLSEETQPHFPEATPLPAGGLLYGNTNSGGPGNQGVLYAFAPKTAALSVLHAFTGGSDGGGPTGDLTLVGHKLYGTTESCTAECQGTVFSYDIPSRAFTTIYKFTGGEDGGNPAYGVTLLNGRLYGTTYYGGKNGAGVLFELDPKTGKERVVHDFPYYGEPAGSEPRPQALIAVNGRLYGETLEGGKKSKTGGDGIIFSYMP